MEVFLRVKFKRAFPSESENEKRKRDREVAFDTETQLKNRRNKRERSMNVIIGIEKQSTPLEVERFASHDPRRGNCCVAGLPFFAMLG